MGLRYGTIPGTRFFGTAANSAIGLALIAVRTTPTLLGGFFCSPVKIPQDADPAKPSNVTILLNTAANSLVNGQVVQLQLQTTIIVPPVITELPVLTANFAVPNGWLITQPQLVTFNNGNGRTYNPGQIPANARIGIRVTRNGPAAADTYAQSTDLAQYVTFTYSTKFPWLPVQI